MLPGSEGRRGCRAPHLREHVPVHVRFARAAGQVMSFKAPTLVGPPGVDVQRRSVGGDHADAPGGETCIEDADGLQRSARKGST